MYSVYTILCIYFIHPYDTEAEINSTFTGREYILLQRWNKIIDQDADYIAFISIVMKFREMFTYPTCKQYKIKTNMGNYLPTAPCSKGRNTVSNKILSIPIFAELPS